MKVFVSRARWPGRETAGGAMSVTLTASTTFREQRGRSTRVRALVTEAVDAKVGAVVDDGARLAEGVLCLGCWPAAQGRRGPRRVRPAGTVSAERLTLRSRTADSQSPRGPGRRLCEVDDLGPEVVDADDVQAPLMNTCGTGRGRPESTGAPPTSAQDAQTPGGENPDSCAGQCSMSERWRLGGPRVAGLRTVGGPNTLERPRTVLHLPSSARGRVRRSRGEEPRCPAVMALTGMSSRSRS